MTTYPKTMQNNPTPEAHSGDAGHIRDVFGFELGRNFRRKGYLFTTFGVPLLGILLVLVLRVIGANQTSDPQVNMAQGMENANDIISEFTPDVGAQFGYVDEAGVVNPEVNTDLLRYENADEARTALNDGSIQQYFVIAPDYRASGTVTVVQSGLDMGNLDNDPIRELLLISLARTVEPQIAARLILPAEYQETTLTLNAPQDGERDEGASFLLAYLFTITLLLSLFVTNGYLLQGMIEEKESRIIEILLATMRPIALLAGKIFSAGLLGLLQMAMWVAGMVIAVRLAAGEGVSGALSSLGAIANIELPIALLPILFIYFILAYLLFAGLYAVIGAISNSMREGPQYAVIFTLPAGLPFYFIGIFSSTPDAALPVIMSLFPLTSPIAMTLRLLVAPVPAWQIALSLGLLALGVVAAIWAAGRAFRVQVLLAGQPPKLRELRKLLR